MFAPYNIYVCTTLSYTKTKDTLKKKSAVMDLNELHMTRNCFVKKSRQAAADKVTDWK